MAISLVNLLCLSESQDLQDTRFLSSLHKLPTDRGESAVYAFVCMPSINSSFLVIFPVPLHPQLICPWLFSTPHLEVDGLAL